MQIDQVVLWIIWGWLLVWAIIIAVMIVMDILKHKKEFKEEKSTWWIAGIIGFITNFFDTLGIGSFGPTTAMVRATKQCDDKMIPGLLNVGDCIPVITEALIFITIIEMDIMTLALMLVAAAIGGIIGARFVSKLPAQPIRLGLGIGLLVVGFSILAQQQGWISMLGTGEALGLTGVPLVVAIIINFFLGALMNIGIGAYAPVMALVYLMGMSPAVAFPVMMGTCATQMPLSSVVFIRSGTYPRKLSMWVGLFGFVSVFIAAFIVKSMPLAVLRYLVVVVLIFTAVTLFMTWNKNRQAAAAPAA
jgi:uncharacterized membrane protein YfcA